MPNFRTTNRERILQFVRDLRRAGFTYDPSNSAVNVRRHTFRTQVHRDTTPYGRERKVYAVTYAAHASSVSLRPKRKVNKRECSECCRVRKIKSGDKCAACYDRWLYNSNPEHRENVLRRNRAAHLRRKARRECLA